MKIGIGLPATISGTSANIVMEWARMTDSGPFSSLGIIDRLAYPNYEPLITLAAPAAVTQRVRPMTTILIAPVRNPGVLAKQAATLDAISGGRWLLGWGWVLGRMITRLPLQNGRPAASVSMPSWPR